MTVYYKCFNCEKRVNYEEIKLKVRCPHCGGKILYKERNVSTKIKAR